jgi:hypothetical protein
MKAAAMAANEAKFCLVFLHLGAMRLKRLSFPMACSIRALPR